MGTRNCSRQYKIKEFYNNSAYNDDGKSQGYLIVEYGGVVVHCNLKIRKFAQKIAMKPS